MKLTHWSFVASALLQSAAAAPQDKTGNDADATKDLGHIVILKQDLPSEHIDKHIEWVNEMHKGTVNGRDNADQGHGIKQTYRSDSINFHGYAGKFSDEALKKIRDHEHVDFVEADQWIHLEPSKRDEQPPDNEKQDSDKVEDTPGNEKEGSDKVEDTPGNEKKPENVGNQNKNNAVGLLTIGQAYNSFLETGKIVDAVIWPKDKKRDESTETVVPAGNETTQVETVFEFTPPATEVEDFKGVDAKQYFEVPKTNEIKDRIAAKLKELKEKRKKKKDEKGKRTPTNQLETRDENAKCAGTLKKEFQHTEDYKNYLETLGISGGATISGWGQRASISGNYLSQAKFAQNSMTYVAFLHVEKQVTTPGGFEFNKARYKPGRFSQDFGDRWIHGFKTGGQMIARVTFTSKDDSKTRDLKAHAEASLKFWRVSGSLSADVQKSMEEADKHINVEVSIFYQGQLGEVMKKTEGSPDSIPSGSAAAVLGEVKSWADKFESHACTHDFAYGPLLDEYDTVPGFSDLEDSPEVPDYDIAHLYALEILSLMVKVEEQKKFLSSAPTLTTKERIKLTRDSINMIKECKEWVKLAVQNPQKAEDEALELIELISIEFIDKYRSVVANAESHIDLTPQQ